MIALVLIDMAVTDTAMLYVLRDGLLEQQQCDVTMGAALFKQGYHLVDEIQLTATLIIRLYIAPGELRYHPRSGKMDTLPVYESGDNRRYSHFSVLPVDGMMFHAHLLAVDRNKDMLPLPPGIKAYYTSMTDAKAIAAFLTQYARGKTVTHLRAVFALLQQEEKYD